MKILVVDDAEDTCRFLEGLLDSAGHHVRCVPSAGRAFLAIPEFNPDLVLLDIMLPGVDGMEVAEALRGDPYTADIPIIHISARRDREARERSLINGIPYLEKPFSNAQLLEEIAKILVAGG